MDIANSLDVRHLLGVGWQVFLTDSVRWHTCRDELDARFIVNGLQLAAAVMRGERAGEEIAQELDEAAATVVRNWGSCRAMRTIAASAACARGPLMSASIAT